MNTSLNEQVLISIIIPSKNRHTLIHQALKSIESQTYQNIEVIVIDDKSSPALDLETLKSSIPSKNLRLLRNQFSIGGAASRNLGIAASRGEYIGFLDDDDIYYPDKITTLLKIIEKNPSIDLVFGKVILNDGKKKYEPLNYPSKFKPELNLMVMNYIHTSASMIRKSSLNNIRFNEQLTRFQDLQFYIELTLKKNILFVNKTVSEWNVDGRDDQITSNQTIEKKIKSYEAFTMLIEYLENDCHMPPKYLLTYKIYRKKLADSARVKLGMSEYLIEFTNLIHIYTFIKSILTKKILFK
jgi:glycosyltransferase involved in cell wall biosynthesis